MRRRPVSDPFDARDFGPFERVSKLPERYICYTLLLGNHRRVPGGWAYTVSASKPSAVPKPQVSLSKVVPSAVPGAAWLSTLAR